MLRITNIPAGESTCQDFLVKLNGMEAQCYAARVSAIPFNRTWPGQQRPLDQTEIAPFLTFTMDSPVCVELEAQRTFEEVVIRPLSAHITPKTQGQSICFTIEKPGQYTVELDGHNKALHIFANPDVDFGVSPEDENVIYFPAGIHHPGVIELRSGQTVYIDQDAVVYGSVFAAFTENIKILGYGVLDGSLEKRDSDSNLYPCDFARRNLYYSPYCYQPSVVQTPIVAPQNPPTGTEICPTKDTLYAHFKDYDCLYGCIHIFKSNCVLINGPVLRDSSTFTIIVAHGKNTVIDNVKLIGMWRYNSDGIDLFSTSNCVIRNSFLRNFDDCVVLKSPNGWDTKNMENILIENCVVWCDWGKNLELGEESDAPEYRNIIFRNCDCIHAAGINIALSLRDSSYIHHVTYENIRVEYSKYDLCSVYHAYDDMEFVPSHNVSALIHAQVHGPETTHSVDHVNGKMSDLTFRNIQILTDCEAEIPEANIIGLDAEHDIKRVRLENFTINGKPVCMDSALKANAFVHDIVIK